MERTSTLSNLSVGAGFGTATLTKSDLPARPLTISAKCRSLLCSGTRSFVHPSRRWMSLRTCGSVMLRLSSALLRNLQLHEPEEGFVGRCFAGQTALFCSPRPYQTRFCHDRSGAVQLTCRGSRKVWTMSFNSWSLAGKSPRQTRKPGNRNCV